MKTHAGPCSAFSNVRLCLPFRRASRKAFGVLLVVTTLLCSVILSSCANTSSANAGLSNAPFGGAQNANPQAFGARSVTLTWTASSSSEVLGYNVYRASGTGGPYMKLNSWIIFATNYTDQTVQSGQTYYYVVTATSSGDLESAYSNEIVAVIP